MAARTKRLLLTLAAALAFALVVPLSASATTTVVDESGDGGWGFFVSGTGSSVLLADGPSTTPLGTGSAQLKVGPVGTNSFQANVRTSAHAGLRLDQIQALSYSTYTSIDGTGGQTPYMQLRVDNDGNGSQDDILHFEPEYQSGYTGNVPDQGANVVGAWQSWNALTGGWWSVFNPGVLGSGASVNTLAHYLATYPNATIIATNGLRVVTGNGAPAWDGYEGAVDNVRVMDSTSDTTYDFERSVGGGVSEVAGTNDTVTTGGSPNATTNPVVTSVTTGGTGGTVTVEESSDLGSGGYAGTTPATSGYKFAGQEVQITAPAGTVSSPLTLTFVLADPDIATDKLEVFRNGVLVPDCSSPLVVQADPDPCVKSITGTTGDVTIVIYTTSASDWGFGAEDVPPQTTLTGGPSDGGATNDTTPTFTYHSSEDPSTFECTLDAVALACPNDGGDGDDGTVTLAALANGTTHTFTVAARDSALNIDASPSSATFTVDTVAPTVDITGGPSGITKATNDPTFPFSVTENETSVVSTTCTLVRTDVDPDDTIETVTPGCSSPAGDGASMDDLANGEYTLTATAVDEAGNSGSDTQSFALDMEAPQVAILNPQPDSNATSGTINVQYADAPYSSTIVSVKCRRYRTVDAAPAFTNCFSPSGLPFSGSPPVTKGYGYAGLLDGTWRFEVEVTDAAGNSASASDEWSVDSQPPVVVITAAPDDPDNDSTPAFSYKVDSDQAPSSGGFTFRCKIDAGSFAACGSGAEDVVVTGGFGPLADGTHTFTVEGRDNAGNTAEDSHSWTLDTVKPVISSTFPTDNGRYVSTSDKPHLAAYGCTDNLDGSPTFAGNVAVGQQIDISGGSDAGTAKTFTIDCEDDAGNSAQKLIPYKTFTFKGLIKDDAPLAYWRLGDATGSSTMADEQGSYPGDYKNAQQSEAAGISGDGDKARHFLAQYGYAYVNGMAAPQTKYTMGAWVRLDDLNGDGYGDDGTIMEHGGGGTLYVKGERARFKHVENRDGVNEAVSSTLLSENVYFHVLATWDGTHSRLYVNGVLEDTELAPEPRPSGISTFYLGFGNGSGVQWLRGYLDEVAYFPANLSATHIYEHWLADPPPADSVPAAPTGDSGDTPTGSGESPGKSGDAPGNSGDAPADGKAGEGEGESRDTGTAPVVCKPEGEARAACVNPLIADIVGRWTRADGTLVDVAKKGKRYVGKVVVTAAQRAKSKARGARARRAAAAKCGLRKGVAALSLTKARKQGSYGGTVLDAIKQKGKCRSRKTPVTATLSSDGETLTLIKKIRGKRVSEKLTRVSG